MTLMMTDIEGSTRLVHELGDGYGKLIREVRRTIKKLVVAHDGHVVDARADESFAVFKSSFQAATCAIAVQRELGQISVPGGKRVKTRIGLHTGRPKISDGNYIGIAVHTAARVCSAAHGGQILLTAQTKDGIKESIPERVTFKKLGVFKMRGLSEPITLLQVEADGLGTKFPPPKVGGE
jgi:class 3 adenylate cyclase